MQNINGWRNPAEIECTDPTINLRDGRLIRLFNNTDFAQGDRLYVGFWQPMKHKERLEGIIPDDDSIVELDYGQVGRLLLYGLERATPPAGDHYDLTECDIPVSCRPGIKKIIQAEINASKPLGRVPKGARKTIPKRISLTLVMAAVEKRHPLIAHPFGAAVGMQLMRKEANILVDMLLAKKHHRPTHP